VGISLWHAPVAAAVVAGRTHEAGRSDCTRKRSLSNAASHGGGDAVDLHHGRSPETWKRDIPPAWPRRHVRGGNLVRVRSFRRPHADRTPGHGGVPVRRRLASAAIRRLDKGDLLWWAPAGPNGNPALSLSARHRRSCSVHQRQGRQRTVAAACRRGTDRAGRGGIDRPYDGRDALRLDGREFPDEHHGKPGSRFRRFRAACLFWSDAIVRSEEHTSELQSLMRISYAVFCLKKKKQTTF